MLSEALVNSKACRLARYDIQSCEYGCAPHYHSLQSQHLGTTGHTFTVNTDCWWYPLPVEREQQTTEPEPNERNIYSKILVHRPSSAQPPLCLTEVKENHSTIIITQTLYIT
ncbi:hypothetical protein E2C01_043864 [Portunus trituberculatus]|uniref:Uncharacterized protein n=1 Tax=Portunus trituberculatus TaxID=210409 RepID=A0A5B7FYG1_PORTR|nr:hypothetical protein [Portunus trituberculatus]